MERSTGEDGGPGSAPASDGREAAVQEMFAGSGEVRALARTLDWGATRHRMAEHGWSPALRIATRAMLDSPFPICLWSGPSYALVYNDAYRRVPLGQASRRARAAGCTGVGGDLGRGGMAVRAGAGRRTAALLRERAVRDGSPRGRRLENAWFDYSLSALRDEDGSVAAILNICPETTGRIRAERALEVESARLEQVFRRAPSFIVAFRGPDLVYEFVNEAYYQLVGHRDILGKPLLEAIPEIRDQGFDATARSTCSRPGSRGSDASPPCCCSALPVLALETRFLDMVFQRLSEADGTHSGVVAHGSDITEQVLARHEVERARDRADRLQRLTAALAADEHAGGGGRRRRRSGSRGGRGHRDARAARGRRERRRRGLSW